MTSDSFVVKPLRFPGGSIGELAVNGTVNDLAMAGARPLALTVSMILEEGLSSEILRAEVEAIARAARAAEVEIVGGDTKVVRARAGRRHVPVHDRDRRRSTPGRLWPPPAIRSRATRSSSRGRSASTARRSCSPATSSTSTPRSSPTPAACGRRSTPCLTVLGTQLHCLRDATRGGVASVLNELARASGVSVLVREADVPVSPVVGAAAELLGIDPMYIANEGRLVALVAPEGTDAALAALRAVSGCEQAAAIGEVRAEPPGMVMVQTAFGGRRVMDQLVGDPLPRIC